MDVVSTARQADSTAEHPAGQLLLLNTNKEHATQMLNLESLEREG